MLEIPAGSVVEVHLRTKEKFRGRLGEISDNMFVVKFAQRDRIEERKVAFEDIRSFKVIEGRSNRMRPLTKTLIVLGVVLGVGTLVTGIFAATGRLSGY